MNHEEIFNFMYERNCWGPSISQYYSGCSGSGSDPTAMAPYIQYVKSFIRSRKIQTIVDLGCGDWRCGPALYGDEFCYYLGYDTYQNMINAHRVTYRDPRWRFETKNCLADLSGMESADLLIVKDVLQHWTDKEVTEFMEFQKAAKKYKYILITNCANTTYETIQKAGEWRTLGKDHPLLAPYTLQEVLRYDTKAILLFEP
jgi:SAM-dependent methyltransferase